MQQDKFLKFKYDASTVEAGKAFAKSELQREAGLPVDPSTPVFGFIGAGRARCAPPPRARHGCLPGLQHRLPAWPAAGGGAVRRALLLRSTPASWPCPTSAPLAPPALSTPQAAWRSRRAWTSCWPP